MRAKWLKFSILPSIKVRVGGQCIAPKTRTTLILDRRHIQVKNQPTNQLINIYKENFYQLIPKLIWYNERVSLKEEALQLCLQIRVKLLLLNLNFSKI